MSDTASPFPVSLRFAYRADDRQQLRGFAKKSLDRKVPATAFWIVALGMYFVMGFVVLGAQKSGFIKTAEVPHVLFAAYAAYTLGAALVVLLGRHRQRRFERASARTIERDDVVWDFEFSEAGIAWKNDTHEARVGWRGVTSIEVWRGAVLIWLTQFRSVAIPARVFADDAARTNLVAAIWRQIDSPGASARVD